VVGSIFARRDNEREHALKIVENVASGNPQCLEPRRRKLPIANSVSLRVIAHRVGLTVEFNGNSTLQTGKVEYVSHRRELPPEAKTLRALPKMMPEDDLRQGQLPTQLARETNIPIRCADSAVSNALLDPSTMLRMVPLPVPGRI
jgi:hypothetical protein